MTVEQLRSLVAYNRWANTRLLQAAAALSVEERERDLGASFGSLQGTLIHILWGERLWLQFWQVGDSVPDPVPGEYPDFASLRSAWIHHQEAYEAYLYGLTQAELDVRRTLDAATYTLGELVQHTLNHSTHHRGQGHAALTAARSCAPVDRLPWLLDGGARSTRLEHNDQYRICFVWKADGAHEVEITDYRL